MAGFSYNDNGEGALSSENPKFPEKEGGAPENVELDEFFQRLPANFRWPKPSEKAVAAAVEAIQRLSGGSGAEAVIAETLVEGNSSAGACAGCGGEMPAAARFCVWCGLAKGSVPGAAPESLPATGQHHVHHHYHHFVSASASQTPVPASDSATGAPRGKVAATPATGNSRAEIAARQVVQDWAQACNIKHLDDVLELYAADATVIRASLPPVRSLPAIREFLFSLLEAGLGDVEMESLRTDVMGDVAIDLGRCKMLVPVAMGKRREERGKYLVVMARQPAGSWKIIADCWTSDLVVGNPPSPEAERKPVETASARKR